jgi:hypothetical protein
MDRCPSSLKADIDRAVGEIHRSFNPLRQEFPLDFRVTDARDGYVCLSIVMPEGMTRVFVSLLQSLYGFFRQIDLKADYAGRINKPVDPAEVEKRNRYRDDYRKTVCSLFDKFIAQGHPSNEAVKLTNAALKKQKHPWATHDLVSLILRSEGRFRKKRKI